jgi:hypothetical protein
MTLANIKALIAANKSNNEGVGQSITTYIMTALFGNLIEKSGGVPAIGTCKSNLLERHSYYI